MLADGGLGRKVSPVLTSPRSRRPPLSLRSLGVVAAPPLLDPSDLLLPAPASLLSCSGTP